MHIETLSGLSVSDLQCDAECDAAPPRAGGGGGWEILPVVQYSTSTMIQISCDSKKVLAAISKLEAHLSKQDDQIKAFSDSVTAQFTAIGTSLDNIAADEASLAKQIADLQANAGELTPENQAALDAILTTAQSMATKTKGIADTVPDVAPPPVA